MDMNNDAGTAAVDTAVNEAPAIETTTSSDAGTGSARDSIDRAFAAVNDASDGPTVEASTEGDSRKRTPDGKFAASEVASLAGDQKAAAAAVDTSKPATPLDEAPARFSADAKAAWATAPEAIKGETRRALTELESGLQKHQETLAPLKPFLDMAQEGGIPLEKALTRYVGIDQLCRQDLPQGLDQICRNMNTSLRAVAEAILGQTPDQAASQSEATIHQLLQKVSQLEQQVGGVAQTFEQQQAAAQNAELAKFVEDFAVEHPRINEPEFRGYVGYLLDTQQAPDLAQAYDKASRVIPGAAPLQAPALTPAASAAKPDLTAQTRKGSLSVTGAPSSGSNPSNRKPPSSARDALDRSFASLGIA